MTQEELRISISKSLHRHCGQVCRNGMEDVEDQPSVKEIMALINQHVAEVIGEDKGFVADGTWDNPTDEYEENQKIEARNDLKVEQRKRVGL